MFEAFAAPTVDVTRKKRFAASTGLSLAVYVVVGAGAVMLASPPAAEKDEDLMDVTFERMIKKEAPPPPPPVADKPPPKPKPKPALVAPTAMPDEKPAEADPTTAVAAAEIPDPAAAVAAPEAAPAEAPPPPPPPKPRPKRIEPISLPEEADPPEADPGNAAPQYPEAARTAGIEGKVILKIAISESGAVIDVKALKGDPMLVEAAIAAVRTWKFSPAMLDGKPIAVYRIVPVSFTSSVGG
jgi:protein TonB